MSLIRDVSCVFGSERDLMNRAKMGSVKAYWFVCVLQAEKHHPALVQLLCNDLKVKSDVLLDFELCLADTQPAVSPLKRT